MYKIKQNKKYYFEIKNSKFYSFLYYVENINDINDILSNLKKEYEKATHYTYAYKIGNIEKKNDDKEPSGTAGTPILNIIEKNNLDNVLIVVIRYYGGIKLGAGGLVRAYTKASKELIDKDNLEPIKEKIKVKIKTDYKNLQNILNLLDNNEIIKKEFNENIIIYAYITKDKKEKLLKHNIKID